MKKEKILPILAAFWFFVIINSFFTWNSFRPFFHIISAFLIPALSLEVINKGIHYKTANKILLSLFLFVFWYAIRANLHVNAILLVIFDFIPLFFIVFWPKSYLCKTYGIIKSIFLFYSIGGTIIVLLSMFGLLGQLPHYVLPAQETIHKDLGLDYNVYGVFPVLGVRDTFVRCYGMTVEPGHFSIYLGLVYMIDRLMRGKMNYWFIPGALSAFSSTFFIILIITETVSFFYSGKRKLFFKYIVYLPLLILVFVTVYSAIPKSYQEEIEFLFYGRNLENAAMILDASNSLDSALDTRASDEGLSIYNRIDETTILFGGEKLTDILSDYRGIIATLGLVGIFLSFLCLYTIFTYSPFKVKLLLFGVFLLILIHRSWMVSNPSFYYLSFLTVALMPDSKYSYERFIKNVISNQTTRYIIKSVSN